MDLFPAIDLRNGKCVRLLQGDYQRQIDYGDDPVAQAQAFEAEGAKWLHVVDLDGAKEGTMHNKKVIERIVRQTHLQVETGGGIRTEETVQQLLEIGVQQTVVGTRALEDLEWFETLTRRYAGRIVLGLDAREGKISTRGWMQTSEMTVAEMARKVNDWPLAAIVYTDIACDGMLTGPNVDATRRLTETCRVPVIASGGVGSLQDIERLAKLPIRGIIVGRALYEGKVTVREALRAIS